MRQIDIFPSAVIRDGQLHFVDDDGLARACRKGAFYLAEPSHIDFAPGVRLARNFSRDADPGLDDRYAGFKERDLGKSKLGYSNPKHDQVEMLQVETDFWEEYFPAPVSEMLWALNEVAKVALKSLMIAVGVKLADLDRITGGMDEDRALQYCIFNHFRSSKQGAVGLTGHKDSGMITVLHTKEGGLVSKEGGEWVPLDPKPGHLTVVIGHSLEVLTRNLPRPIRASFHRVQSTDNADREVTNRISFGVYIGPRMDQNLTEYSESGVLSDVEPFIEFQKANARAMNYEFHPKFEVQDA